MNEKEIEFNLPKNIKASVISVIANIFLAFLTYRLLITFHGIELVGVWSILVAASSLVNIGNLGMGVAVIRYVSKINLIKDKAAAKFFIDTGIIVNFIWHGLLTLIAYHVIHFFLSELVPTEFYEEALLALPFLMFANFLSSMTITLISSLQSIHKGFVGFNISTLGSFIEILFALILIPGIGIYGFALAQAIRYFISLLLSWHYIYSYLDYKSFFPKNFSILSFKKMITYSVKVQAGGVLNSLFEPFTKLTLSQFGDVKAQGIFELAYKTVSLSRNIIVAGLLASIPAITNLYNSSIIEAKAFYQKAQDKLFFYLTVIMLFLAIASPFVSIIWMGNLNYEYILLVSIFATGYWVNTLGANAYNLGFASGIMKHNLISSLMLLLSFFILFILLKELDLSASLIVAISANLSLVLSGFYIKIQNEKTILTNR
jgi:O-antigen/teichoic acid export membrane protein